MYENNEEQSDIIGKSCTLLNPYKGYTEGTVVGDYGLPDQWQRNIRVPG